MLIGGAAVGFFNGDVGHAAAVLARMDWISFLVGGREVKIDAARVCDGKFFEPVHGFVEHSPQVLRRSQALQLDSQAVLFRFRRRHASSHTRFPPS